MVISLVYECDRCLEGTKLTAYHGSELDFDARYQLAHEIDEICNAYLVKRTVELGKQAGSGEDPKTKLNQSGKDDKIAADR